MDNRSVSRVLLERSTESEQRRIKLVSISFAFVIILPSFVQPLDHGIIYSFKARYCKWYLRLLVIKMAIQSCEFQRLEKLKPDLCARFVCLDEIWDTFSATVIYSNWR